jgi:hypothetical protein
MALLSLIVLGLFAVFNQTQRAFMTSMGHTDVLEGGRTVTDMMLRDMEQLTPSGGIAINFLVRAARNPSGVSDLIGSDLTPLKQNLPSSALILPLRTNYLEDIFILTRQNQSWVGIGYCVRVADSTGALYPAQLGTGQAGVGSLYRFSENLPVLSPPPNGTNLVYTSYPTGARVSKSYPAGVPLDPSILLYDFLVASQNGSQLMPNRICDGVVHLQVRSFATNGFPLYSLGIGTAPLFRTNFTVGYSVVKQATARYASIFPDKIDQLYTWSNAVPASVELELGILEPRSFARFDSIPLATARLAYFQRDDMSTRVHLFRQRVPVRNVDPTAFQ